MVRRRRFNLRPTFFTLLLDLVVGEKSCSLSEAERNKIFQRKLAKLNATPFRLSVNAPVIERSRNEPYADVETIYAKLLFLFLKIHSNRYNHMPQNCLSKADTFSCIIKTLLCNNQYKEKDIGIRLGVQAKHNPKQLNE